MILHFTPNIHFTKLIKAAEKLREFNFRKITSPNGPLFSIDVADDRGNRITFKMVQEGNSWRFVDQTLPAWIVAAEEQLNAKIAEEAHTF